MNKEHPPPLLKGGEIFIYNPLHVGSNHVHSIAHIQHMKKGLCSVVERNRVVLVFAFSLYQEPQSWEIRLCLLCTCFQTARRKCARSHSNAWPQTSKSILNVAWPTYISLPWVKSSYSPRQPCHIPFKVLLHCSLLLSPLSWSCCFLFHWKKVEESRALPHALITQST